MMLDWKNLSKKFHFRHNFVSVKIFYTKTRLNNMKVEFDFTIFNKTLRLTGTELDICLTFVIPRGDCMKI